MSLAALSGFTQGLGAGINRRRDREERDAERVIYDRYFDALSGNGDSAAPSQMPSSGMGAVRPPDGEATLDGLLYTHEGAGNPDTLFGHSQREGSPFSGVRVSEMTIDEASEFSAPSGPYGQWVKGRLAELGQTPRVATPMGYGQIVGTTLRNASQEMGLPGDTVFNRKTQGQIINHLASRRLSGAGSPAAKRAALRAEWEGFKNVSDSTLDAAIANFEQGGGTLRSRGMGVRPE
jgi:hypothetical protein